MKRFALVVSVLALVYCSNPVATDDGPVLFSLLDGDGQVVTAGRDSLIEPVVARAVRGPSQALLPIGAVTLYAQGTSTGVPNVRTCAKPKGDPGLEPWVDCLDTDSAGVVNYWMQPPTKAGEHCAEIRAIVDGQPEIVATTCSTVEPGPPAAGTGLLANCTGNGVAASDTLDLSSAKEGGVQDSYGNPITWSLAAFPTSSLYTVRGDGYGIIAAAEGSGVDSVQVMHAGSSLRTIHVYVRHPEVNARIMAYQWPADRACGDGGLPTPP